MKTLVHTLAVLAGVLMLGASAPAATLKIGDPAPPLQTSKWLQGDPVREFDTNHIYVVEFWTMKSGPCRASIPHLNDLWQKFKDKNVVVIGQDVSEPDESLVPPFIQKMGDQMTFRVALDDTSGQKDGAMVNHWLRAAGLSGVPVAFIVDQRGRIAWIGHPMDLDESLLEKVRTGQFDVAAFARDFEKKQSDQVQLQTLALSLNQSMLDKNWDAADAAISEIRKLLPAGARGEADLMRLQVLLGRQDYTHACQLAVTLSDAQPDNAELQNNLAWSLATAQGLDQPALALANKMATRANFAASGKEPGILDTLARTQFMTGQTNEAVASEQAALNLASGQTKTYLSKCLTAYLQGKLPEISLRQQP